MKVCVNINEKISNALYDKVHFKNNTQELISFKYTTGG